MTIEKCSVTCDDFDYFGVEYSRECYCGDVVGGSEVLSTQCSMTCGGNSAQTCGGPDRQFFPVDSPSDSK